MRFVLQDDRGNYYSGNDIDRGPQYSTLIDDAVIFTARLDGGNLRVDQDLPERDLRIVPVSISVKPQ
jgi:hypothetical protein